MKKKTAAKPLVRGASKKAPLTIGSRKGSSNAGAPDAQLAKLEQDLLAAIDDAIGAMKKLRDRVEELGAERASVEPQMLLAATPMSPTRLASD